MGLPDASVQLMSAARVEKAIRRLSQQVVEDVKDVSKVLIVALEPRGNLVATRLCRHMAQGDRKPALLSVHKEAAASSFSALSSEYVLLVDDVVFSGKTALNIVSLIRQSLNPDTIRTLFLVDRGHRKLPLKADFVGMESPTKLDEHVEVQQNSTGDLEVVLHLSHL